MDFCLEWWTEVAEDRVCGLGDIGGKHLGSATEQLDNS
jgi:hypothetical protein